MSDERGTHSDSDRTREPTVTRRRLLSLAGAGATAGLAGCNALGGDGGDDPAETEPASAAPTDGATPERTATPTKTPRETATGTAVPSGFDASVLEDSPSSHVAPTDGFADATWLSGAMPEVVTVTNLDASGEGSLRWALNRSGARVVVFEVGGVIDLEGASLNVSRPNVFVAGQTAPSPGITVIRGGIHVATDNVILQHLRARPGDELSGPIDAITNDDGSNVIIDHCTAAWATDEGMSTNSPSAPDVTLTNNLVAECLVDSIHPKGPHSMGSLVMNNSDNVTLAGNLWAHNVGRHPRLKGGTSAAVVNNVMYDFDRGTNLGGGVSDETTASIVGNYYRAGSITDESEPVVGATFTDADGPVRAYVAYNETDPSMPVVDQGAPIESLSERPVWPEGITTKRAGDAYESVLAGVGARPADRTAHDRRILEDVRERTGSPIDSQDEVGGYPELEATTRELSVPDENLGAWLREFTVAVESV